ncbi:hypothetical protein [Butyrivibrio sp. AC2005]|uniref:hypothetical protein n=1 Tax=Butyrivibrio sp. AC2005 TaxID=1280672 RepID=UPI00047B17F5|nr:hypothetical protein [Butyrivibrio sp. AC2005]
MKREEKSSVINILLAAIIGVILDVIYVTLIDFLNIESFLGFIIYCIIFLIGFLALIFFDLQKNKGFLGIISVIIGFITAQITHFTIFNHYHLFYHIIFRKFYPMSDDMGYIFFMIYLEIVYLILAVILLVFGIRKIIKRNCNK